MHPIIIVFFCFLQDQHRFQLGDMDDAAECFVSGTVLS